MKKDVVLLVIDSLGADEFNDEQYGVTAIPFIRRITSENTYVPYYYSQGSHTESALPGLICGVNGLDYNAYLHRFNDSPKTIFDYFYENGYETFNISWGRNTFPERVQNYTTNYYTAAFSFSDALFYIIPYYKKIYEMGVFTEKDREDIIFCYEDAFSGGLKFWNTKENVEHAYDLLGNVVEEEYSYVLEILKKEYDLFCENKWEYVKKDLIRGSVTENMSNNHTKPNKVLDREKLSRIKNEYSNYIRRFKKKQFLSNLFDPRLDYFLLFRKLLGRVLGKRDIYLSNWYSRFSSAKMFDFDKVDKLRDDGSSLETQLEFLEKLLTEKKTDKPKFVYMHVNTPHPPIDWISFDKEEETIKKDINRAIKLFENTKGFHGDLIFRIGMGYVDRCINDFYDRMKQRGFLDKLTLTITADHGSPLGSRPIRYGRQANNCNSETYHVPMIIVDKGIKKGVLDGYYESIDYLPSILDICGIKRDQYLSGKSFFDEKRKVDYSHTERIASGCPCLEHRNVIYTIRNKLYLIEYEVSIFQDFEAGKINEVYNLSLDPNELHNISGKVSTLDIQYLLQYLKNRHLELQENYKAYCEENYQNYIFEKKGWKEVPWDPAMKG
ncbi:MAG: sulfatase-like hydrolase/transferase [Ruminococcus sp.]|nr:sulfatase-like hydrolase/transferase [Ruminococcus sp.]